jgi:hypothetical protein
MSKKQPENLTEKAASVAKGMTLQMQKDLLNWKEEWPDLRRQDFLMARGLLVETKHMFDKPWLSPLGEAVLTILRTKGPLPESKRDRRNRILAAEREVLRCAKAWVRTCKIAADGGKTTEEALKTATKALLALEQK